MSAADNATWVGATIAVVAAILNVAKYFDDRRIAKKKSRQEDKGLEVENQNSTNILTAQFIGSMQVRMSELEDWVTEREEAHRAEMKFLIDHYNDQITKLTKENSELQGLLARERNEHMTCRELKHLPWSRNAYRDVDVGVADLHDH
jgi:hypothetical protein